jgi:hypothetical protein
MGPSDYATLALSYENTIAAANYRLSISRTDQSVKGATIEFLLEAAATRRPNRRTLRTALSRAHTTSLACRSGSEQAHAHAPHPFLGRVCRVQRFSIGLEVVGDEVADMGLLGGGAFARLPQGIYKIANLVEGVDGNIKLDGVARQPRDPVRSLKEENPFGRGQPIKAEVVDPVGEMVGMGMDLQVLDLGRPQVLANRLACRFPLSPVPDLTRSRSSQAASARLSQPGKSNNA